MPLSYFSARARSCRVRLPRPNFLRECRASIRLVLQAPPSILLKSGCKVDCRLLRLLRRRPYSGFARVQFIEDGGRVLDSQIMAHSLSKSSFTDRTRYVCTQVSVSVYHVFSVGRSQISRREDYVLRLLMGINVRLSMMNFHLFRLSQRCFSCSTTSSSQAKKMVGQDDPQF